MSNELELIDYINIIYLKNQLVCLPVEKLLEKYQKEAAKNVKKKIQADKRLADKQRREANR